MTSAPQTATSLQIRSNTPPGPLCFGSPSRLWQLLVQQPFVPIKSSRHSEVADMHRSANTYQQRETCMRNRFRRYYPVLRPLPASLPLFNSRALHTFPLQRIHLGLPFFIHSERRGNGGGGNKRTSKLGFLGVRDGVRRCVRLYPSLRMINSYVFTRSHIFLVWVSSDLKNSER